MRRATNGIAISRAARVLAKQGLTLYPPVGTLLLSASRVIVAVNAQRAAPAETLGRLADAKRPQAVRDHEQACAHVGEDRHPEGCQPGNAETDEDGLDHD